MTEDDRPLQDAARAFLTNGFDVLSLLRAIGPVCRAVVLEPKPFFGAIGADNSVSFVNALGFFVASLVVYLVIQVAFEQFLIQAAGLESPLLIPYHAAPFAGLGAVLANTLGFLSATADAIAENLFFVAYNTLAFWAIAQAFIHVGKIASLRAFAIAGLYATGAAVLALCFLSLPAAYFDGAIDSVFDDNASTLDAFARFVRDAGLATKYEAILLYVYLRSISFTTALRLHWGFVFTVLCFYVVSLVMRGL